jgi:chemotaxis protein MotB
VKDPHGPRSRVGHDRWLVSYADFITLMFAFFVVMYAFARADYKKQVQVAQAIDSGFRSLGAFSNHGQRDGESGSSGAAPGGAGGNSAVVANLEEPGAVRQDLERLRAELARTFASQIAGHAIALEMGRDGLVISLREAGFFDSGSATPKPEALPTLRAIAVKLGPEPYDLRVEGHTDNVPIHTAAFDSNWELSSMRATGIARLFLEMKAIQPERISAAGYAEFHPVASNATPEGRAENRRVDLVVMPRVNFNFAPGAQTSPSDWRKVTDGD